MQRTIVLLAVIFLLAGVIVSAPSLSGLSNTSADRPALVTVVADEFAYLGITYPEAVYENGEWVVKLHPDDADGTQTTLLGVSLIPLGVSLLSSMYVYENVTLTTITNQFESQQSVVVDVIAIDENGDVYDENWDHREETLAPTEWFNNSYDFGCNRDLLGNQQGGEATFRFEINSSGDGKTTDLTREVVVRCIEE